MALDIPHDVHYATLFVLGASVVLNHGVDNNLNWKVGVFDRGRLSGWRNVSVVQTRSWAQVTLTHK